MNVFDYFVKDGIYYFCDFVAGPFHSKKADLTRSSIAHITRDPTTIYEAWLDIEPNDLNDPDSDMYLALMYTTGYYGDPTMPNIWLKDFQDGKYSQIMLSDEEKDSQNILFWRDGYSFNF